MFGVFQFGSLLDENAGSKFDSIGLNAMANKDKAGKSESESPEPVYTFYISHWNRNIKD